MNRNLHSLTVLTEFARFDVDESESMLTKLVNKITVGFYNSGSKETKSSTDENLPEHEIGVTSDDCAEELKQCKIDQQLLQSPKHSPSVSSRGSHEIKNQGRNSVNVLERLRNLVSHKSAVADQRSFSVAGRGGSSCWADLVSWPSFLIFLVPEVRHPLDVDFLNLVATLSSNT
uniref:(northern house mosquito) hypothetical protein n=1 Tax=Culex pipiens TaxID=7175 RepID=A0A8D8G4H4_CULPI